MKTKITVSLMVITALLFSLYWQGYYLFHNTIPWVSHITIYGTNMVLLVPFSRATDAFLATPFMAICLWVYHRCKKTFWLSLYPIIAIAAVFAPELLQYSSHGHGNIPTGILGSSIFLFAIGLLISIAAYNPYNGLFFLLSGSFVVGIRYGILIGIETSAIIGSLQILAVVWVTCRKLFGKENPEEVTYLDPSRSITES